jgi:hypothetical protein
MPRDRLDRQPNERLHAARQRTVSPSDSGHVMSRQELADAVNSYLWEKYRRDERLDRSDIGKLERGVTLWPSAKRREALRTVLGAASDTELGFCGTRSRPIPRQPAERAPCDPLVAAPATVGPVVDRQSLPHRLSRRGLLGATSAGVLASLLEPSGTPLPRVVDPAVVDHFRALRAFLVGSDNEFGGASIFPTVRQQLDLITQLRRQAAGALRRQLLRCEAQWAEFAGWLIDDLGDPVAGGWWLGQSVSMAREADDRDFSAYLFARMAQRARGGPDEDRVAGLARTSARENTRQPQIRAFAALQRAHGHAMAGEVRLFQCAIAEARTLVDGANSQQGDLGSFCTVQYILVNEGEGWLRLNRPRPALQSFDSALANWPSPYHRDRGLYLCSAARAKLSAGQPEEAAMLSLEGLTLARTTRSNRIEKAVRNLSRQLADFAHIPAVNELVAAFPTGGDKTS